MININNLIDLTNLTWTKTRQSSGTAGSYLKSYSYINGKKVYYKLSYFDNVNETFGYESFNEVITDRLLDILNFNHLKYHLVFATLKINEKKYNTYLTYTYDFKKPFETKMTLENFYEINKNENENIIDFCHRYNFIKEIYQMIIIDYLIINRDRHGANIEVLYNSKTKNYRIAPLFDHGLSFLSPAYEKDDINNYNIMDNKKVNSYVGTNSLEENIKIVPKDFFTPININFDIIFDDIINEYNEKYMVKAKQLLKRRWNEIENIFNKK